MIQATDAGKTDCCCHAVTRKPDPLFIRILIRHCRSECPGRNCMARGKRFSAIPEPTVTDCFVRTFPVCGSFEHLNNKPAVQKGFESGTPGLLGPSVV